MRRRDRTCALLAIVALALLTLASGCGARDTVRVAAAANLQAVMEELRPDMEAACDCEITVVFGSSGLLHEQIAAGAEFAVFLSADDEFVDRLAEQGHVLPESVHTYATGQLALVTREGLEPVTAVDDLARGDIERIAIANPRHAPYGRAAQEALEAVGLWATTEERIVYGENIRQATDYVSSGDVDAGLVALSLVIDSFAEYELVPGELHAPIPQAGGVVAGEHREAGAAILDYVMSDAGQGQLAAFGFGAPD